MSIAQAGCYLCSLHPLSFHDCYSGSGVDKFICQCFYTCKGEHVCLVLPLLVGNTVTVAVWSISVPHWQNVQLGKLNISLFDSFHHVFRNIQYGRQVLSRIYDYMCRKNNNQKTEIPLGHCKACQGCIQIKKMTSLPCIIHIWGSNLILTTTILHFWSYNVHPSGGGCYQITH